MRLVVTSFGELAYVGENGRSLGRLVVVRATRSNRIEGGKRLVVAPGAAKKVRTDTVHNRALGRNITPFDRPREHLGGPVPADPRLLDRTGVVTRPRRRKEIRGGLATKLAEGAEPDTSASHGDSDVGTT